VALRESNIEDDRAKFLTILGDFIIRLCLAPEQIDPVLKEVQEAFVNIFA
jgi:hypothetical protein